MFCEGNNLVINRWGGRVVLRVVRKEFRLVMLIIYCRFCIYFKV